MAERRTRRRLLHDAALGGAALLAGGGSGHAQPPAVTPVPQTGRQQLESLINGFRVSQMLHVAATLGIADHLEDGPRTIQQLAEATKAHGDSLYRLLRALAGFGIFAEEDGPRFRLTPAAEMLRSRGAGSLRMAAIVAGEEWMWRPWGSLLHSVKTGEAAFDHLYGKNTFNWLSEHPEAARIYDAFQAEGTRNSAEAVAAAYDFSGAGTVVDVGGGAGVLLFTILRRNASARGILFDLDHVAKSAQSAVDRDVASRCQFVGGDFFKAVPRGGDIYILKSIIHDWDDGRALAILANCRAAMAGAGRLLMVEELLCGPNQPCRAKLGDLNMLVRIGGRNRTETEYRALLTKAGFTVTRVLPAQGDFHVMEAVPKG